MSELMIHGTYDTIRLPFSCIENMPVTKHEYADFNGRFQVLKLKGDGTRAEETEYQVMRGSKLYSYLRSYSPRVYEGEYNLGRKLGQRIAKTGKRVTIIESNKLTQYKTNVVDCYLSELRSGFFQENKDRNIDCKAISSNGYLFIFVAEYEKLGVLHQLAFEYKKDYKMSNNITTPADHRAMLLASMEAVIEGRMNVSQANAVASLSGEVHKSIKQQWDMATYAS